MKTLFFLAALALTLIGRPAQAYYDAPPNFWEHVDAVVSLRDQVIKVSVYTIENFRQDYVWPISSGRKGYETPPGKYNVLWADAKHRSSIYENAPMPFAVFFTGGYAIHGTTEVKHLGQPASHGCVRLDPANAEILYNAVNRVGKDNARIMILAN